MKRNQKGLTLTEMAIVLGAMGLIIAAIWAVVGTVWDGYRFRKMNQEIQTVAQTIQDYYGNIGCLCSNITASTKTPYADDANITGIIDDNTHMLLPVDMRLTRGVAGGDINHAMATVGGGSFQVISRNSGARFRIRLLGLKQESCIRLLLEFPAAVPEMGVAHIGAIGSGTNEIDIDANNTVDPTPSSAIVIPMLPSVATAWCDNPLNNEVFIDFRVRK